MTVQDQLAAMSREPRPLAPDDFEQSTNQTGTASDILTLKTETVLALQDGADLMVSLPAYETFETDGTGGNTETFGLSNDLVDSPNTQALVIWEGSNRVSPDSVDYNADSFDYTDDGTASTLHVYYVAGDAATVRVEKRIPGGKTDASEELDSFNAGLAHRQDQQDRPITLNLTDSWLERFLATDMTLAVTIDAPYTVRFSEDTDGTSATNALFHTQATKGNGQAQGLLAAIREDMGQR